MNNEMNKNDVLLENKTKNKFIKNLNWNLFYKKIIIEICCIVLFILTIVFRKRTYFFSKILSKFLFNLPLSGLSIYYISLIFIFVVNTIELIINIKNYKKNNYSLSLKLEKIFDMPLFICKCLTGFIFLMIYITSPCTVLGKSMEDTFLDGDKVLCVNIFSSVDRNDVVVLDASNYGDNDSFYIKRVIARGGDTIKYDKDTYRFYINDEVLKYYNSDKIQIFSKNNYDNFFINKEIEEIPYEYTLESDEIILMGDNRDNSNDSRSFGMVKLDDIYGIVYLRIFPFNKIRFF